MMKRLLINWLWWLHTFVQGATTWSKSTNTTVESVSAVIRYSQASSGRENMSPNMSPALYFSRREAEPSASRSSSLAVPSLKKAILCTSSLETAEEKVKQLVEALKADGFDFTVGIDPMTPIVDADRVVSAGKGIGDKKNMKLIEDLAKQAADAFGSFKSLDGVLFADEVNFDRDWIDEARRYYTNIVGKYGPEVMHLLKKAQTIDIKILYPLHGPIW